MKGFTLIELAVVLVIMGFLTGFGLLALVKGIGGGVNDARQEKNADEAYAKVLQYASDRDVLPDNDSFRDFSAKELGYAAYSASADICSDDTPGLKLKICPDAGCADYGSADNVSFAVWNTKIYALDKNAEAGTLVLMPAGGSVKNMRAGSRYATLRELRAVIGCGKRGPRVANDSLPSIIRGAPVNLIKISATGGRGGYRWCVEEPEKSAGRNIFSEVASTPGLKILDASGNIRKTYEKCPEKPSLWGGETDYLIISGNDNDTRVLANGSYRIKARLADERNELGAADYVLTVTGLE